MMTPEEIAALKAQSDAQRVNMFSINSEEPSKRQNFDPASPNDGKAQSTPSAPSSGKSSSPNENSAPTATITVAELERQKADLEYKIRERKEELRVIKKNTEELEQKHAADEERLNFLQTITDQSLGPAIAKLMADKRLDEFWEMLLAKEMHSRLLEIVRRTPGYKEPKDLIEKMTKTNKALERLFTNPEHGVFSKMAKGAGSDVVAKAMFQHIKDRLGQEVKKEFKNLIPDLPKSGF